MTVTSLVSRVERFDHAGLELAARARRRWVSPLVAAFTRTGNLGLLWLAIGATIDQAGHVVVLLIATTIASEGIKRVAQRERPSWRRLECLIGHQRTTSFPSGHAASAAGAAIILTAAAPALAPLWVSLAGLMTVSRVYVGVHYPSDVAIGALLGTAIGVLSLTASALF
jgi:membrane-associated phospholipid phosphatase